MHKQIEQESTITRCLKFSTDKKIKKYCKK